MDIVMVGRHADFAREIVKPRVRQGRFISQRFEVADF
jgi:hypothetical protein